MNKWLDSFEDGGSFLGTTNAPLSYNGAWGGPAQHGKKITVASKDDPRYQAYQDSLKIYKEGQDLKRIVQQSDTPGEYKEALAGKLKKTSSNTSTTIRDTDDVAAFNRLTKLNKTQPKPISHYHRDYTLLGMNVASADVLLFKKPQQPVIVNTNIQPDIRKVNTTKGKQVKEIEIAKGIPGSTTPIFEEAGKKYVMKGDLKVEVPPKPVEKRAKVKPISLNSVGLNPVGDNLGNSEAIHNPTRVPKYYEIEDTSNPNAGFGEGYGGSKSMYRTDNPYTLPPSDNRKVTPRFQDGGRTIKKESFDLLTPRQQGIVSDETAFNTDWFNRRENTFDPEGNPIPVEKGLFSKVKPFDPQILPVKKGTTAGFDPKTGITSLQENFPEIEGTIGHEDLHQYDESLPLDKYMQYVGNPAVESMKLSTLLKEDDGKDPLFKYMRDPQEVHSYIQELRQHNKLDPTKPVTREMMESMKFNDSNLLDEYYDKDEIRGMLNSMVMNDDNSLTPIAQSGITKDDNGYWNPDNWGKPVEIGSNKITMKGVNQPLIGISDTGDMKYMNQGEDYKFDGKKVTEFPIAQNGGGLTKLDQLTNFTNYNKPQKGGWLDQFN